MESGNGGASSKGVLVPVSDTSDVFQNCILAPLQSAYLYEESQQFFKYKSAVLVKNPALEEKYNIFRAKRREAGYSEEDLKETYGFILFEDVNKAHALGETGVLTRNGTCTTLGDPCKGVYISIYSDCLDLNRWYHGKSGYIAIIRLTKGRVKKVLENYTQNFTAPTVGFDCHVSEQLSSVSAQTSSFLAFERTQYYMYELLGDGSNETAQSPSAACPFAIVSFSYTDTKAMLVAQQETSAEKKLVCHHLPWRGQLQIGTQFYNVALRSAAGALIPAKLPPVVKVNRAISMSDLIQLLPKGVFETVFSGEVFLDNLYCSLCELISSEADETNSLTLLLQQIKEKDLALPVPLNDGGFLILLHSSHFLTYDDSGSSATEVLQGMFVFPESRAIQKGTKSGQRNTTMSSDIFQILPVITYAESEVEKTPLDASDELCEVLAQHMQNYAALINPGLTLSPSRDVSIFPDQYDVLDAHKHLYSTPDWTNRAWQSFKSYMSKPVSFQLSVSEASEILAAGKEERREDLDDDVYICLSSPEEAPANPVDMGSEDQLTDQKCPVNVETPAHSCLTSSGAQVDFTTVPQNVAADDLQAGDATKDNEKSEKSLLVKTDDAVTKNLLINRTSDDLSAELIVSITSAEQTLTDESLSVISTVSATKQNDFQLSGFSAAKLETAEANSLHDETVKINNKDCPEVTNVTKRKGRKLRRGPPKGLKKASENLSSQTVKTPGVDEFSTGQKDDQAKDSSGHSKLNNLANVDWRKLPRRKRKFGKLSSRNKKVRSATVDVAVAEEKKSAPGQQSSDSNIVMELEVCPLRKKTERWDLKPVISKCGRVLVPYGSVYVADLIRCLKNKPWCTKDQRHPEKMLVDGVNAPDRAEVVQDSGSVPEMALGITEATTSKDGGNHLQNVVTSCDKTENGLLRQSDYGLLPLNPESNGHSLNNEGTDTPPSEAVKEKHTDVPSPGKCASKEDFLKLKSVFFRRKRKNNFFVSDGTATDLALNTEPCLKKGKGDSDAETLKSNNAIASAAVNDVSKMQSVDPLFAYALGLTPKVKPDKVLKSEGQYSQLREDSTETQEQTLLDKQPQIIQKPPSIFPRSSRIKTLRKHQGIPAEYIKKKCTPFQVSPLSGSTRLLHARQQLHGEGIQTLYPSVCQEDKPERNHRTQECLKKYMVQRRKFRHFRTFVNKGPSVQVTRQWKENYDFNRDSKFSKDSKDRTIIRALHGPWDYSIQDTTEEVRLIVHMWIGLFYSRSTARFFHMESNFECSEESYSVEMSSKMVPAAPALLELKADSFGASTSVTDTQDPSISKTLDLCKKDNSFLDKGSAILDLSLRNCSAETVVSDPQVNRKETSGSGEETEASETLNMLKSSTGLQECQKTMVHSTEIMNDVSKLGSIYENVKACSPSQNTGCLEHIDVPSFKSDGLFTPPRKEMESVLDQTENVGTALGTGYILHGCNKDETYMNDGLKNPETSLAQIHDTDSSESMKDKKREFNKEADEVTHTDEHDDIKSKENLCHDETIEVSPKVIDGVDDSTNKELGVISNGNCFKNEKQLSNEEPKSVSSSQAENVNEDVHCQTVCEGQMTTGEDRIGRDCCVSAVACDSNLGDQPLPVMCEGPDSVKDCITDCGLQAPSQTGNEKDTCQNLQLTKLPANGSALTDEHAIPGNAPVTPSEMEPDHNQHANENNSENDICLADKVQYQMAALPTSPERNFSLDGSCQAESIPQTKDNLKTGSQNITMTIFNFGPSSDHIKSEVGKKQGDNTTHEEPFHSPQSEVVKKCEPEPEEALTTETDLAMNKTNEGLEKSYGGVVIPFIGLDMSGEDIQPHISQQQSKVEEVIQGQKEVPFVSEASYSDMPKEICSKSDGNISLPVSETNHPGVLGSESNDRCPTPTLDERPYDCRLCSGPSSSTSAFSSNENNKNITCTYPSSSKLKTDEMPPEQKLCHSTVDSDLKPHHGLHPDLELRTPRVLQRIDKLFSKSNHTDKSNQMEIAEKKNYTDQTSTLNSKRTLTCLAPSYTSADVKDEKISNKPVAVSPSPSHELHKESPDHFLISPFKSKLEEVLGVKLQLKKMDLPLPQHAFERTDQSQEISIGQDYCHSQTSIPSEFLQTITSNINQDRPKTTPQSNLNHEPRSYSQRPVMAVKPSKSDESQAHCISKDGQIENSPKSKHTKTPVVTYTTPTTMAKKTNHFEGNSRLNDEKQESSAFLSRSTLLSKVTDTKSNSDSVKFSFLDPSNQYQVKDTKISSSSLSMQSFESAKSDGHQSFLTCSLLEKVLQTTKENVVINQKDCSKASTSFVDHKDSSVINVMGPQSSLTCTIHNSSQKRSYSFLEQVSQRCLKGDITQVSMEQECLIFSEQMKQVLKRSKRGAVCKQDSQDEQPLSCTSPVTVCFSSLEEQEDSVELLDMPSLVGQKIMVDVSDRKSMTDLTEEEKTLHPQKSSPGPGNLKEHAGVSGATAECARLYDAMMDDVCAVKKVPSGPERFRMDRSHIKTGPSNHFDFCDEMKREVDESFRSNLNSVVKKSCKTKNRFYILVTSDDALFDKTKAQLEAQGHMAIQPSEFLLHEGSSSSLLIILKNEDIAEHICEIPHLLELKKSSGVQFVGIDEPDDVVNLTYQELFMRGGFIMFDRAVLEILSICDMKKFSKILHKLSRTGKWKWMLHYRDSRRLKENARLSTEAKEKKHFLNSCEETGILEVLPYHECDLMSRDQPDYLTCLVRLQVQNISARYPIFITDTMPDSTFGRNGILTMTVDSFLTNSTSEIFTV